MSNHQDVFIQAIHSKNKVRITFASKEDKVLLVRKCAPMDYGPSRRAKEKHDRFHVWDYESDTQNHTLSLSPEQIREMEILHGEQFNPSEFITWSTFDTPWFVERNWGVYS